MLKIPELLLVLAQRGHVKAYVSDTHKMMCKAWGDPHYNTFDGERIDYMGIDSYIMAELAYECSDRLQHFQLIVDQEMRNGDTTLSYVNWIMLRIMYKDGSMPTMVKVAKHHIITVSMHPSICMSCAPVCSLTSICGFRFSGNFR